MSYGPSPILANSYEPGGSLHTRHRALVDVQDVQEVRDVQIAFTVYGKHGAKMLEQEKVPRTVILKKIEDWDNWYMVIRTAAKVAKVWQYINPETPEHELPTLDEPEEPLFSDVQEGATTMKDLTDIPTREHFKYLHNKYKDQMEIYTKRELSLDSFNTEIQRSIGKGVLTQIRECTTPYEMLVKLRLLYSPTDMTRQQDVRTKYQALRVLPKTHNIETWLNDWVEVVQDARLVNLPEVSEHWPVRDFVRAVEKIEPSFYSYWTHKMINKGKFPTLHKIIENFRTHVRERTSEITSEHGVFTATFQDSKSNKTATATSTQKPAAMEKDNSHTEEKPWKRDGICICGERHPLRHCPYVFESKQSSGWKEDLTVAQSVRDKISNSKRLQKVVKKLQGIAVPQHDNPEAGAGGGFLATFTTDVQRGTASQSKVPGSCTDYVLQDSFILDCGATTHICNNRERFKDFNTSNQDSLYAGDKLVPIKGYGAVDITVRPSDNKTRIVTLANVAYVPTFHTNTISFRRFEEAGGYWDTRATPQCLMHGGKPFAITEKQYGQYVVEYNSIASRTTGATFPTDSAKPRSIARATTDIGVHRTNEESRTRHLESELQEEGDEQEDLGGGSGNITNKGGILYEGGVTPPHLSGSSERQPSPPNSPFPSPPQTPENRGGMAVYDTSAMIGNENQQATTVEKPKTCCTKVSNTGIDPANIVESRTRSRKAAYLADIGVPEELQGIHAAFTAGQEPSRTKLHRDKLPLPPKRWKDVQKHPFRTNFEDYDRRFSKDDYKQPGFPRKKCQQMV